MIGRGTYDTEGEHMIGRRTVTAIFHTKNCQTKKSRVEIPKSLR